MREFSVWAPNAGTVELILSEASTSMTQADSGWWHVAVECAADAAYAFSLDSGGPRPDPQGLRLPHGPHGWSQLFDPAEFAWSDGSWPGIDLPTAVVYECTSARSPRRGLWTRRSLGSATSSNSGSRWWS